MAWWQILLIVVGGMILGAGISFAYVVYSLANSWH